MTAGGEHAAGDAAAQLKRLLALVPRIADGESHSIAEMAAMLGVDTRTVVADLASLGERNDTPGGFVEGLQVFIDAERASVRTDHFLRPMRLTVAELHALDLGLSMLRAERGAEEWSVIDRARERIRAVVPKLRGVSEAESQYAAGGAPLGGGPLALIRRALETHHKVRLRYRRADATNARERIVCPYRLMVHGPVWYLVAYCEESEGIRVFRVDRIDDAEITGTRCEVPDLSAVDERLTHGAFVSDTLATLRVRYSPVIARWLEERSEGVVEADGSFVVEYPLADLDWAVRHVLAYGKEAEILAPEEARAAMRERLAAMLESVLASGSD